MSEEQTKEPVKEEVKVEKKVQQAPQPLAVIEGAMAPTNNMELARVVQQIAKGGGFPERFDTFEKQLAAYNLAHSLMGARWQIALNNIAVIKGAMCIYGELPGALAEQTKEVAEKKLFCIDREYNEICTRNKNLNAEVFAGVCIIQRKGREKKEFVYTIDEATAAGQYPAKKRDGTINHDSPWMKFTKVMLMRKAMNLGVKFEFPNALCGTPVAEYDYDEAPDFKDVTPSVSHEDRVKSLNSRFSGDGNEATVQ